MKATVRTLGVVTIAFVLAVFAGSAQAAAPVIIAEVQGVELLPQAGSHGAIFIFDIKGTVNGSKKCGWGWVEVFHESPLPIPGKSKCITGGRGAMWFGISRFDVDVLDGMLWGLPADLFSLDISLGISNWRGQTTSHAFLGILSHQVFPPTIGGKVQPWPYSWSSPSDNVLRSGWRAARAWSAAAINRSIAR